jgi:hypothetical protein
VVVEFDSLIRGLLASFADLRRDDWRWPASSTDSLLLAGGVAPLSLPVLAAGAPSSPDTLTGHLPPCGGLVCL